MKCKTAQDLILTDWLDNQMAQPEKAQLETHLDTCQGCSDFASTAREALLEPFTENEHLQAPPDLWNSITDRIQREKRQNLAGKNGLLDRLRGCFTMPVPAMAMASVVSVILATTLFLQRGPNSGPIAFDPAIHVDHLATLLDNDSISMNGQAGGFDTPIEEYFL